jgi:hypothetical protein
VLGRGGGGRVGGGLVGVGLVARLFGGRVICRDACMLMVLLMLLVGSGVSVLESGVGVVADGLLHERI